MGTSVSPCLGDIGKAEAAVTRGKTLIDHLSTLATHNIGEAWGVLENNHSAVIDSPPLRPRVCMSLRKSSRTDIEHDLPPG